MPSNRQAARAGSRPAVSKPARAAQQADLVPVIDKLVNLIDVLAKKIDKIN